MVQTISKYFQRLDYQKILGNLYSLLVFLAPLYFNPRTSSDPFEFHKATLVYVFTSIIFVFWILSLIQQKKLSLCRNKVLLPVALFFIFNVVSYFLSVHPYSSLWGNYWRFNGGITSLFCYLALFFIFITSFKNNTKVRKEIISSIVFSSLFSSIYSISQLIQYQSLGLRVTSTFGQPNFLGAYLVFVLPLNIYLIIKEEGRRVKWGLSLLLFANIFSLMATQSRASWFGLGLIILASLWIFKKTIFRKKNLKYLALSVFLFFLILVPFKKQIQNRINTNLFTEVQNQEIKNGTLSLRLFAWEGALKTFLDDPLFGTGPETMFFVIPRHISVQKNNHFEWAFRFDKAHNEPLDVLANTGIFSFLSYIALILIALIGLLKSKNNESRFLGLSFLGLLGSNLFGFSCVTIALYFWITVALYCAQLDSEKDTKIKNSNKILVLVIILSFLALSAIGYSWIKIYRANSFYNRGDYLMAVQINPNLDYYRGTLAMQYLEFGDTEAAAEEAQKAVELNPLNSDNYRVQFLVYKGRDSGKAVVALDNMIALDPNNAQVYYEKGAFLNEIGSQEKAKEYLQKALDMKIDYREARELLDKIE